jgi:hypothetical protein
MKIFNVSIRVQIDQVLEIPDTEPEPAKREPFNDDPLDKAEKIMDRYIQKTGLGRAPLVAMPFPGMGSDGTMMTENVKVQAETFEELQNILMKFHMKFQELPAVPESLITQHLQNLAARA